MLVKYEFLKIIRKRSTGIFLLVSLLATVFFFGLPVIQYYTVSEDGDHRGLEGIKYQKEQYENISVLLTEDYITAAIREVQELFLDPANISFDGQEWFLIGGAYWDGIAYRENLLNMIATTYAEPNFAAGYNSLTSIDVDDGADFYGARQEKIEKILDTPARRLSEAEKEYWLEKNSHVKTPFSYGYYEGWEVFISCFELFVFPILAICMILCPVFSGEYQTGTDAVLLSAKYGKTKLTTAKIAASLLFGVAAFTLHAAVAFGITFMAYGTDGWDLPLQLAGTTVPYPFTFLQGTGIHLGIVYLVLFAMIGLTLFLSAKVKSPYFVLLVLVPVIFLPMFLAPNGTAGLYSLTLFLTPYQSMIPAFGKYLTYSFGEVVLDAFSVRAILYALLAAVLLPLAGFGFRKHQVFNFV